VNWLTVAPPADGARVSAQIRSTHRAAPGTLTHRESGAIEIRFDQPQSAITPGQTCAIYDGERVLGGAAIAAAVPAVPAERAGA
jgi:tRNA-specific 2-thiouridylase